MKSLCVSLETAKKLKAAGWTKPTAFAYDEVGIIHKSGNDIKRETFCPTAEEVLRELPFGIENKPWYLNLCRVSCSEALGGKKNDWVVSYSEPGTAANPYPAPIHYSGDKSLSEAAAQMWLWCVENGYIKTEAKP